MTEIEYARWKDFALRMARTCFNNYRRPNRLWIIEQVESWFGCLDYDQSWQDYNSWDQDSPCLCSHVDEFYDGLCCFGHLCRACRDYDPNTECRCIEIEMLAYEQFHEQWLGPVRCCLRAGIDMVCEPSAGVIGFTAGDIRRMYEDEGVPEWLFPPRERLRYFMSDEINGTFRQLPDEAGIVL